MCVGGRWGEFGGSGVGMLGRGGQRRGLSAPKPHNFYFGPHHKVQTQAWGHQGL